MIGMWKFASRGGKEKGLLALYTLHSLGKEPKTGYALLKEIGEKTDGTWSPSKGALYPLLKQLEEEGLIKISKTGQRGKNVFGLTPKGRKTLGNIKKRKKDSGERLLHFKNLLIDIFGEERVTLRGLLFDIRRTLDDLPPDKEEDAVRVLERCLDDLKEME